VFFLEKSAYLWPMRFRQKKDSLQIASSTYKNFLVTVQIYHGGWASANGHRASFGMTLLQGFASSKQVGA
jgi:hypothetical protein